MPSLRRCALKLARGSSYGYCFIRFRTFADTTRLELYFLSKYLPCLPPRLHAYHLLSHTLTCVCVSHWYTIAPLSVGKYAIATGYEVWKPLAPCLLKFNGIMRSYRGKSTNNFKRKDEERIESLTSSEFTQYFSQLNAFDIYPYVQAII